MASKNSLNWFRRVSHHPILLVSLWIAQFQQSRTCMSISPHVYFMKPEYNVKLCLVSQHKLMNSFISNFKFCTVEIAYRDKIQTIAIETRLVYRWTIKNIHMQSQSLVCWQIGNAIVSEYLTIMYDYCKKKYRWKWNIY